MHTELPGDFDLVPDQYMKYALALAGVAQWIECWPAEARGCWFDSQSGHMPGLWARSPVGGA